MTDRHLPLEQPLSIIFHSTSQKTPFLPPKKQVSSVIFGRLFSPGIVLVSQKSAVTPSPFKLPNKTACLFVMATSMVLLQLWSPSHLPSRVECSPTSFSANETPAGGPAVNTNALIDESTISQPK